MKLFARFSFARLFSFRKKRHYRRQNGDKYFEY